MARALLSNQKRTNRQQTAGLARKNWGIGKNGNRAFVTYYQGFLGFSVDWDHRFDPGSPLYRQISRGNLVLHLSEHHGDGSPGVHVRVMMQGVEAFHREISAKGYRYMRPGLERMPWGTLETGAIDPFGNLIRFCERIDKPADVQ